MNTWNIDLDLDSKIDTWKKIYLTYIVECFDVKVYKTRRGFHIRNVPKHIEYLRSLVDCEGRIRMEEIRARWGGRRYVLFNRKSTIQFIKGKILVSSNEEEVVDKDVILSFI